MNKILIALFLVLSVPLVSATGYCGWDRPICTVLNNSLYLTNITQNITVYNNFTSNFTTIYNLTNNITQNITLNISNNYYTNITENITGNSGGWTNTSVNTSTLLKVFIYNDTYLNKIYPRDVNQVLSIDGTDSGAELLADGATIKLATDYLELVSLDRILLHGDTIVFNSTKCPSGQFLSSNATTGVIYCATPGSSGGADGTGGWVNTSSYTSTNLPVRVGRTTSTGNGEVFLVNGTSEFNLPAGQGIASLFSFGTSEGGYMGNTGEFSKWGIFDYSNDLGVIEVNNVSDSVWLGNGLLKVNTTGNIVDMSSASLYAGNTLFVDALTGRVGINNMTPLYTLDVDKSDVNRIAHFEGNINGYFETNIENHNNGSSSSSCYTATSNDGNTTSNYISLCKNNANYSETGYGSSANDGELLVNKGNLWLGTDTPTKNITFVVGGSLKNNTKMSLSSDYVLADAILTPKQDDVFQVYDDFCGLLASSMIGYMGFGITSGAVVAGTGDNTHPCTMALRTAAGTNSGYAISTSQSSLSLTSGYVSDIIFKKNTRTAPLNITNMWVGFGDSSSASEPVDGAYFFINDSLVIAKVSVNSVRVNDSKSYTMTTGSYYRARITVLSTTLTKFQLYNSTSTNRDLLYEVNLSASIPNAAGRETGSGVGVYVIGGSAAADIANVDTMNTYSMNKINR